MSDKIKQALSAIRSLAAAPPEPPTDFTPRAVPSRADPTKGVPAKPGTAPIGHHGISLPEVKQMQESMQQLAQEVAQDSQAATIVPKPREAVIPTATEPVKASKKGFGDFMAQYMGALSPKKKGVEWTPDTSVTDVSEKQKTQTDIHELDTVMNNLLRIGGGASEFKADGVWGSRTDNALKNIAAFAEALLRLEGDLGLPNEIYHHQHLDEFRNELSGYQVVGRTITLPDKEKKDRAPKITKHLKAIIMLYRYFRQKVLMRSDYRQFIEGQKGFEKYKVEQPLSDQQNQVINDPKSQLTFTAQNGDSYSIPLSAMKDKASFDKYVAEIGFDNVEQWAPSLIKSIKKQLRLP